MVRVLKVGSTSKAKEKTERADPSKSCPPTTFLDLHLSPLLQTDTPVDQTSPVFSLDPLPSDARLG